MSTLAFLLSPEREIPKETDENWFAHCCAWTHGTFMAWVQQRGAVNPQPRRPWFDNNGLTTNAADYLGVYRQPMKMNVPPT